MAVMNIDDGRPDGATFGQSSTEKISFYGVTTVAQPAPSAAVGTDLATVIVELADLRAQFVTLGLIAS